MSRSAPNSTARRRNRTIASRLSCWFRAAARDLPWRRDRTGYTALVAEAMLQQTQVGRVVERYVTFLDRFPTVSALAAASEQEVFAVWQGLGYYRRARHLHAAAKQIVYEHGGEVPRTAESLRKLPGVGRYTAGAIASIAFGERVPIVDGNVARLLARLDGRPGNVRDREGEAWCWARATELVDAAAEPGDCNEAMMELGALVCTPRLPKCDACPIASLCTSRRKNQQHEIPSAAKAAAKQTIHHHALIVLRSGRLLIEQRPANGLWAGLWQVPTIEASNRLGPAQVRRRFERRYGTTLDRCTRLERFVHQTTHRRVEFDVFRAAPTAAIDGTWRPMDALAEIPFGSPQRRITQLAAG